MSRGGRGLAGAGGGGARRSGVQAPGAPTLRGTVAPGPPAASSRGGSKAMAPLWALLALGGLRLGLGERGRGEGAEPREGGPL